MRILITGCKGQLGTELQKQLAEGRSEIGELPAVYRGATAVPIDIDTLDLTSREDTFRFLRDESLDLVINCAAYTNVDGCETNEDAAYSANALAVRNLADVCEMTSTRLLHVSTDYVFAGDGSVPYREYDLPSPKSVYGKTKLAGEVFVRERCRRYFVVRTSWLYGYTGKNFVKTILRLARERGEVTVVNDQFGNPTSAVDVAHSIFEIAAGDGYGTYHATCNGVCSWYDFAKRFVEAAGVNAVVKPCTTEEFGSPTSRPAYSALDNMMLRLTTGDHMRDWRDAIDAYIKNGGGE